MIHLLLVHLRFVLVIDAKRSDDELLHGAASDEGLGVVLRLQPRILRFPMNGEGIELINDEQ